MGQTASLEECHEHVGKWSQTCIKGLEAGFTAEGIADEHRDKVDQIVVIKPSASKSHLRFDEVHQTIRFEDLSHKSDFSEPTRRGGSGFWGNLDVDGSMCHTTCVFSF
jgi:hypothetical protein